MNLAAISDNWSINNDIANKAAFINVEDYDNIQAYEYGEEYHIDSDIKEAMQMNQGSGVKTAVIDTGITGDTNDNDAWHGLMIYNLISEIVPETQVTSYNIFSDGKANVSDVLESIIDCEKQGVSVINCSWTVNYESPVLEYVIENSNMLFVCAAGNNGKDLAQSAVYPAAYNSDNVITVGAVDVNGELCSYSNYSNEIIDITAQGDNIVSVDNNGNEYKSNGTSFAAAFVSAAAAMVYSSDQALSAADVKNKVINSAVSLSTLTGRVHNGKFLNALNAVKGENNNSVVVLDSVDVNNTLSNTDDIQLFSVDNSDSEWQLVGNTNTLRNSFATAVYEDKIYVLGGIQNDNNAALNAVEAYDTISGTWEQLTAMPHIRSNPKAVASNGQIYVFSGKLSDTAIDVYDISSDTWTSSLEFPYENDGYAVGLKDDEIYVFGGWNSRNVYKYSISNDTWTQATSLSSYIRNAKVVYAQYDIDSEGFYILDGDCEGKAIAYNENSQYINNIDALSGFAAAAISKASQNGETDDFRIYITGGADIDGENPVNSNSALYHNNAAYGSKVSWLGMQRLPEPMSYHGTEIVNGYMYAFGGKTGNNIYRISATANIDDEGYDITNDEWATGSINNNADKDYFSFSPSKSGYYVIDTGDSELLAKFYMDGIYNNGYSTDGFIQYLTKGRTYKFRIEANPDKAYCIKYKLRFVDVTASTYQLTLNEMKSISLQENNSNLKCPIQNANELRLEVNEDVLVEIFMGSDSVKYSYAAGKYCSCQAKL